MVGSIFYSLKCSEGKFALCMVEKSNVTTLWSNTLALRPSISLRCKWIQNWYKKSTGYNSGHLKSTLKTSSWGLSISQSKLLLLKASGKERIILLTLSDRSNIGRPANLILTGLPSSIISCHVKLPQRLKLVSIFQIKTRSSGNPAQFGITFQPWLRRKDHTYWITGVSFEVQIFAVALLWSRKIPADFSWQVTFWVHAYWPCRKFHYISSLAQEKAKNKPHPLQFSINLSLMKKLTSVHTFIGTWHTTKPLLIFSE